MFYVYAIYQSKQSKINAFTKFGNILIIEKSENRGLEQITFRLKELRSYILHIKLNFCVQPSFFTIRVYLSLHFLPIVFENHFFVFLCFMSFLPGESF